MSTTGGPLEEIPLLVSMTVRELFHAATGRDERLAEFAAVVAEAADGIELFVEPREANMSSTQAAVTYADSLGLSIRTIHTPPFGVTEDGLDGRWNVEWNTHLKEVLLNYERDETLTAERSPSGRPAIRRVPKLEPEVATAHPPRFAAESETSLSDARHRLVETFRATIGHIASDRFVEAPLDLPTLSVENVCPRPGFEYLLTDPADVERLRRVASKSGEADLLAFTCDVGHAETPAAMLDAMEAPANIHVHGVSDAPPDEVVDRLPGDVSPTGLTTEPADGTVQHLPPNEFPDRTESAVDWLADTGHECPLTVELQRPYKTPTVARDLFKWFDGLR
ncbi:MAG: hypothetical protein ACQET5_17015 [Halobacteriota archaeon]